MQRTFRRLGVCGGFSALIAISACNAHGPVVPARLAGVKSARPSSCSLDERSSALLPSSRASGTVAVATQGARTLAFIADEDAQQVSVVDVDLGQEIASAELNAAPGGLLVLPSGMVLVTLPQLSQLQLLAFDGKALRARCAVATAAEPVALAVTPDARAVLVASAWGHTLAAYATATLGELYRVELAREPRGVVVD